MGTSHNQQVMFYLKVDQNLECLWVCIGWQSRESKAEQRRRRRRRNSKSREHAMQENNVLPDPFLSLDCARVEGVGAQSKERKGSNFAA